VTADDTGEDLPAPSDALVEESSADAVTVPSSRGARRMPSIRVAGIGLVIVALGVVVVISQWQLSDQRSLNSERSSATSAARAYATAVSTYDYRHLKQDFSAVEDESTASFRHTFATSSAALTKVLTQYKATADGKVLASGVSSISGDRAVVVLFVNQTVKNTAQKSGSTTDNSRIEMTLVRPGSKWLIDQVKLL
jgi:Mce-associated membrane protein